MASRAAKPAMPTSAPGSDPDRLSIPRPAPRRARGFTLVELLIVVALVALVSGLVSMAVRDPDASQLDQEAVRLIALLESARAEARASGLLARWEPVQRQSGQDGPVGDFRFVGLPDADQRPTRWLHEGVTATVIGARAVQLGPEPIVAAQQLMLALNSRQLMLATDGLGPFRVISSDVPAER